MQALASALGASFSGLVGLACAAAAICVAGLWALMGLAVAAGALRCAVQHSWGWVDSCCCRAQAPVPWFQHEGCAPPPTCTQLPSSRAPHRHRPLPFSTGVFLSGVMTVLSFSLLVAALVSGSMAAGALMSERAA